MTTKESFTMPTMPRDRLDETEHAKKLDAAASEARDKCVADGHSGKYAEYFEKACWDRRIHPEAPLPRVSAASFARYEAGTQEPPAKRSTCTPAEEKALDRARDRHVAELQKGGEFSVERFKRLAEEELEKRPY